MMHDRDAYEDDSSKALGLDHRREIRGVVRMPDRGYDPELSGKSPDEIIAILAVRAEAADAHADLAALMREHPGGRTGHSHSHGRTRHKPAPRPDHTKLSAVALRPNDELRPVTVSGRVSLEAFAGIKRDGNPHAGEILERIGRALLGMSFTELCARLVA